MQPTVITGPISKNRWILFLAHMDPVPVEQMNMETLNSAVMDMHASRLYSENFVTMLPGISAPQCAQMVKFSIH